MIRTRKLQSLALPELGFGCAPLGNLFTVISDDQAEKTLEAAWESGVRFFDTAPWYGRGLSELRLGRFLRSKPRSEYFLSTKVGRVFRRRRDITKPVVDSWAGGLSLEHGWDYSRDGILRSYEDSIQRLGIDSVDLLVIHDLDLGYHKTEDAAGAHLRALETSGAGALAELKRSGHIKAYGAGINEYGFTPRFLNIMEIDFFLVALRLTLLEHEKFIAEELPAIEARQAKIIIGGVFSSGIAATGAVKGAKFNYADAGPEIVARVKALEVLCRAHGTTLAAAALAFPLRFPAVASVIPGALAPDQPGRNRSLYDTPPPEEFWRAVRGTLPRLI